MVSIINTILLFILIINIEKCIDNFNTVSPA